jgi:hypothetical protein
MRIVGVTRRPCSAANGVVPMPEFLERKPWRSAMAVSSSRYAITAVWAAVGIAAWPLLAGANPAAPDATMDAACPKELKDNVLAALWKRRPAPKPKGSDPTVTIRYRNDYGRPADALLFALDGAAVKLECNAGEKSEAVLFSGPLAPGIHHLDAVFDFGFGKGGRGGRSPLTFKVRPGKKYAFRVVVDRNDEEWPVARIESAQPERRSN